MSLLMQLFQILEDSRKEADALLADPSSADFLLVEKCGGAADSSKNMLARGDNLTFMQYLLHQKNMKGKLDLIYVDPPFFSKADYGAEIKLVKLAPLGDPIEVNVRGYELSLRKSDAEMIEVK